MESVLNMKTILQNKMYGCLKSYLYAKAVLKYVSNKYDCVPNIAKYPKILIILTIFLLIGLELSLVICKAYRLIIHYTLKFKLRSNYRGLFQGTEAIFVIEESNYSRSIVTILFLIEFNGNGKDFCKTARQEIIRIFSKNKLEKLLWTKHFFFGYYYYQLCELDYEEFISEVDCDGLEPLNLCLNSLGNRELPMGDSALWDVTLGRNAIDGRGFPLIFRFHHCLGDAVSIFNLFSRDFNNNSAIVDGVRREKKKVELRPVERRFVEDPFLQMFSIVEEPDRSLFCGKEISGEKYLVWYSETSPKYLSMIKEIKRKFAGEVTFMNVVLTALSASLNNYAQQKTDLYPKILSAVLTMCPIKSAFENYGREENYELNNKFTVGVVKLPLRLENVYSKKEDLIQRFNSIRHDYHVLKNKSLDYAFNRWQAVVCLKYFPYFISTKYVRSYEPTLLLSNIPGCAHLEFFGSSSVKDFVVFDPNISTSGISLMLTSYEGRLNFGFTVDKSIIANQGDAEWICRDILDNIEELHRI